VNTLTLGNLEIDRDRYEVRVEQQRIELTFTEFSLLEELVRHAGKVVLQEALLDAVWGEPSPRFTGRLRVQMSRLRKKIAASRRWHIQTVTKRGYVLVDGEEHAPLPALTGERGEAAV
jgi:DNA-binding response OmpR family regulator